MCVCMCVCLAVLWNDALICCDPAVLDVGLRTGIKLWASNSGTDLGQTMVEQRPNFKFPAHSGWPYIGLACTGNPTYRFSMLVIF